MPPVLGFHHLTLPATDPMASGDWYAQVFGFVHLLVAEQEDAVDAVLLDHPSGALLHADGLRVQLHTREGLSGEDT